MAAVIRLRRDTAANWASANPVLALGEPGLETDTLKWKVGDGTTAFNTLDYFGEDGTGATEIDELSDAITNATSVYLGTGAGEDLTTGVENTATGIDALGAVTSGNDNTAMGHTAGNGILTGSSNTFVGAAADASADVTGATVMGAAATTSGNDSVAVGETATAGGAGAIALGQGAAAVAANAIAIGDGATNNNADTIQLGNDSVTSATLGDGSATLNAVLDGGGA